MDPHLVTLTAAALAGLMSKEHARHGVAPKSLEDLGREAAAAGRAAFAALEEQATTPEPKGLARGKAR